MPLASIWISTDLTEAVFLYCADSEALSHVQEDDGKIAGWDFTATPAILKAVETLKANPDAPIPASRVVDAIIALKAFKVVENQAADTPTRVRVKAEHVAFIRAYLDNLPPPGHYNGEELRQALEERFNVKLTDRKYRSWMESAERGKPVKLPQVPKAKK